MNFLLKVTKKGKNFIWVKRRSQWSKGFINGSMGCSKCQLYPREFCSLNPPHFTQFLFFQKKIILVRYSSTYGLGEQLNTCPTVNPYIYMNHGILIFTRFTSYILFYYYLIDLQQEGQSNTMRDPSTGQRIYLLLVRLCRDGVVSIISRCPRSYYFELCMGPHLIARVVVEDGNEGQK